MSDKVWMRVAGAAGIGYIVAWWVAVFTAASGGGEGPDPAVADRTETVDYMTGLTVNSAGRFGFALAALLLVWFAAGLSARLRHAGSSSVVSAAALGGGLLAAALMLMGNAVLLGQQFPAMTELGDDTLLLINALQLAPGILSEVGFAGLLIAVGIGSIASRALPRWLGWPAVVIGALELVDAVDPLGAPVPMIVLVRMLWIVIAGVVDRKSVV